MGHSYVEAFDVGNLRSIGIEPRHELTHHVFDGIALGELLATPLVEHLEHIVYGRNVNFQFVSHGVLHWFRRGCLFRLAVVWRGTRRVA